MTNIEVHDENNIDAYSSFYRRYRSKS